MAFRFASKDPTLTIILKQMKRFIFSGEESELSGLVKRVGHLEPEHLHQFS